MSLAAALGAATCRTVTGLRAVPGGDLNDAFAVTFDDGSRAFVKTRDGADAEGYRAEGAGLAWLGEPGALRVPTVLAVGGDEQPFLALEWVEAGGARDDEALGRGLALTHRAGAPHHGFVPHGDGLHLGPLTLPLGDGPWPETYGERLLAPLAARAGLERELEPLLTRMADLAGPAESPARLHGDLWGGNVIAPAVLIDPAAYGGHREIDLAMLALFGAVSPRLHAAYEEVWPLSDGHAERVGLWQLFPLLVHAVLFGGGYTDQARRTMARYG